MARKPLHPGETREGSRAAARAPHSSLASVRNSWKLGTSCKQSACSSVDKSLGSYMLPCGKGQGGAGLQVHWGDVFNAPAFCDDLAVLGCIRPAVRVPVAPVSRCFQVFSRTSLGGLQEGGCCRKVPNLFDVWLLYQKSCLGPVPGCQELLRGQRDSRQTPKILWVLSY